MADAAVFGVNDSSGHEQITAAVVLKQGANSIGENLANFVDNKIGEDFKKLRGGVHVIRKIPKNSTGVRTIMNRFGKPFSQ